MSDTPVEGSIYLSRVSQLTVPHPIAFVVVKHRVKEIVSDNSIQERKRKRCTIDMLRPRTRMQLLDDLRRESNRNGLGFPSNLRRPRRSLNPVLFPSSQTNSEVGTLHPQRAHGTSHVLGDFFATLPLIYPSSDF
jgi:hypothetical protein